MGSVWSAEDTVLGRKVALKLLPERLAASTEARQRFLREARAACSLTHPGIATVFDAGEESGQVFTTFELIDGETIRDRARRGPLPIEDAVRLAREAAEALAYAHQNGILHRDVTSGNVMVNRGDHAKIVDFGLAALEGESRITQDGSSMGTVGYMAPEVAQGDPADRRSDLYGLGVVLYEMVTGRLPFGGARPEAVLYSVVHEPVPPASRWRAGVPKDLDQVLLKLLAKDAEDRYQSAEDLATDLRRLERGDRVTTARSQVVLAAIGAAAVIAVIVWAIDPFTSPPRYDSVAVLPLENRGDSPAESNYLAEGVGGALVTKLSKIDGLRVTPWITSQGYPPGAIPTRDIARQLNVDALVIGTFRKRTDELQVNVSLVDGTTGEQDWTGKFQVEETRLMELSEIVASAVGARLRGRLGASEERALAEKPTSSRQAYDQYLRGASAMWVETQDASSAAMSHFRRALDLDPGLTDAHVGIGAVSAFHYYYGWGGEETLDLAEQSFQRALDLDPTHMGARRGLIRVFWERGQSAECLRLGQEVRDARQISIETMLTQAEAFVFGGLPGEAIPLLQTVGRIDPANEGGHRMLLNALCWAAEYEATIESGEEFFRRFREDPSVHLLLAWAYAALNDTDHSRAHHDRLLELFGDEPLDFVYFYAAFVYQSVGRDDDAIRLLHTGIDYLEARLAAFPGNQRLQGSLALHYALLGDARKVETIEADLERISSPGLPFPLAYSILGDHVRAAELMRRRLENGCFPTFEVTLFGDLGIVDFENPAYRSFLEERQRAEERLRSLYAN